jgi:hypothetical protein
MFDAASRTRAVLVAFVAVAITPFAVAVTHSWFWQHKHNQAPVGTAVYLLVVAALVRGRYRWAWLLLALFYGAALVSSVFDSHRFTARALLYEVLGCAAVVLLLSTPMRHRLRQPIRFRGHG